MGGERTSCSLMYCLLLTVTVILSQNSLSPGPVVYVINGSNLTLVCSTNSIWKSISFYDNAVSTNGLAVVVFQAKGNTCKIFYIEMAFGKDKYTAQPCVVGRPVGIIIYNITTSYHNKKIGCKVELGTAPVETTVKIREKMTAPKLETEDTITGKEGESLSIECTVKSIPKADITWYIGETLLQGDIQTSSPYENIVLSNITFTAKRSFDKLQLHCRGNDTFTSMNSSRVTLNILYLPTVVIYPVRSPYTVVENTTNINLNCKVTSSNPNVTSYIWYKDGLHIAAVTTYSISTIHRSDTGNYICNATNSVGTSSSAVQLNVLYGIEISSIMESQPIEGGVLNITCSGQSNPAMRDNDVTWTKQNNNTFTMKGQRLVVRNVNRIDSGIYICLVVIQLNPNFGQPVNVTGKKTAEVDVLYLPAATIFPASSPYTVVENTTNFNLSCTVTDGNPTATSYNWYKDGSHISTAAIYTISTVYRTDTGNYTCDATNKAGSSNPSSAVEVHVLYGIKINPIKKNQPTEGQVLNITCSVKSYLVLTDYDATWTKKNNRGFSLNGRHLVINNVNRINSGIYICSVVIQFKPTLGHPVNFTGSTTAEVDVLYKPTVSVFPDFNQSYVTENATALRMICNVTDANPALYKSYSWSKDGKDEIQSAATYTIPTVKRSHTGSYTCDASNLVGASDPSPVFQLNVLYGVSLKLSDKEISLNESERWNFSCIYDGNPQPTIVCVYLLNGSVVGETNTNVKTIGAEHASCKDTGLYMCTGNNKIGTPVSQSAHIKVACKPRTYNNVNKQDIFINETNGRLNITATFISFPLSNIAWFRQLPGENITDIDSEFTETTIPSQLPYETISILQKDHLKQDEFGIYLVNATNIHGSFLMKYHVIQKRYPTPPSYVYVVCKSTTAIVILKPMVNENMSQDLYIQYTVGAQDMTPIKVHVNDRNQHIEYTVTGLNQGRKYNFSILAVNQFGETRSNQMECLTETLSFGQDMLEPKEDNSGMFSAGIASLVIGLLFFVAATILTFRKRFKKSYTKPSKSNEYYDLQKNNTAFQDPYTSLQNPIESRHHQEPSSNTYEECGNADDAAAYQNIENMKSGHKKAEKNMDIYDDVKN